MKRNVLRLLCIIMLLSLPSCSKASDPCFHKGKKQKDERNLVIFSTNDMHGRFDGFAKIAPIVQAEKARGNSVLLLCAGDKYTGNPIVDQHEEPGFPIVELMNQVGYQYETFGNHEFDYGQEVLEERMKQSAFETLCCNVEMNPKLTSLPQPRPYTIINMEGIRVCLLGIAQAQPIDNGSWLPAAHPGKLRGLTFHDPVSSALQYRSLRDSCDVFIALTHIGTTEDIRLAEAMPELDAIIGGHSHTKIQEKTLVNGVLIAQAECWLKYLAKTTLTLRNNKVVDKDYTLISLTKKRKEVPEIRSMIEDYKKNTIMKEAIGAVATQFSGREDLSTLMTDALIEMLDVDIAFQNSGGIRIGELKKGPVTREDILTLNPFQNTVFIYDMTPAELREMILRSHRKASKRADLLPGGIRYTIFTQDDTATRVEITDIQGKPLDENRKYRVAFNSYINSVYFIPRTCIGNEIEKTDSELLIDYILRVRSIAPKPSRTEIR
ncbi:MAG: bifunctional metallophosphatase/5'-nucleotidase [Bacteroidaceae bacterium]|nr:bifunctional metallophosphatase/5'-nucleotidase [Bacteroidaceae bacterium]